MKKILLFLICLLAFSFSMHAQIEKVIVETYYVADSADAADTTYGKLEAGATTYRVYIDLKPGSKLKKIYGDANHRLRISSTSDFYNHTGSHPTTGGGQSFGKEFLNLPYLKKNTTALDTWLTIGQMTKASTQKTYFGVLKSQDRDGNAIAGSKNSAGLLANSSLDAGIPLTDADGIDTMMITSTSNWADVGIRNLAGEDSTIFGSLNPGSEFISNDTYLSNNTGVTGVIPDSNQVLVAQLTTKGELSFELNVEVEQPNPNPAIPYPITVKYVANDDTLLESEEFFKGLAYPFVEVCGCPDPRYVEYRKDRDCDKTDSCKTLIIFGCTDTMACNYDPAANTNVPSLCCYPGLCNDRDLAILCPSLVPEKTRVNVIIFPNPVQDNISIQFSDSHNQECKYVIYDSFGRVLIEKEMGIVSGSATDRADVSGLKPGMYMLRLFAGDVLENKMFMKH